MTILRQLHTLRNLLLLAVVLLSAQSLALWHSHDKADAHEAACQLCVHAQQYTPAPVTAVEHVLALFVPVAVSTPFNTVSADVVYHVTIPARAPPARFLA